MGSAGLVFRDRPTLGKRPREVRSSCTNFEESRGCGPPLAIFHSQTSFLRRENRKSGACYNKRPPRRAEVTLSLETEEDRLSLSLSLASSLIGYAVLCRFTLGKRKEIQRNSGRAHLRPSASVASRHDGHLVKRGLRLCPNSLRRRRRGMRDSLKRRFKREAVLPSLFSADAVKKFARSANNGVGRSVGRSSKENSSRLRGSFVRLR